jgi:hypothetical protein
MLAGILTVIGSFANHYIPGIGPYLAGAVDTLAAILQVIARGIVG